MIVFRPFKGEIMLGKISSATEHGIKSTILTESTRSKQKWQDTNDVLYCSWCWVLQWYPCTPGSPVRWSQIVSCYYTPIYIHSSLFLLLTDRSDYADQVWIWDSEDGSSFYFDVGEVVRLRVEMEEWHDQIPNAPDLGDASTIERKPPYSIIVSPWFFALSYQRLFMLILR